MLPTSDPRQNIVTSIISHNFKFKTTEGEKMEGYVKIYRKMMHSPIWLDPDLFRLWMYCLMKASHKERKILVDKQEVKLERGQFVTGRFSLHQEFNQGIPPRKQTKDTTLWNWLKRLEKMGNLDIKTTNKYSVVSIVNWSEYQVILTTEPQQNDNKLTTDSQQIDTNKNVNNVENDKSPRQKFKYEPSDMELANLLFNYIQDNGDGANKVKNPDMDKWANDIRLIRTRDKKTHEQIRKAIEWSQNNSFWRTVILSPSKLREKYTQLSIKAKEENAKFKEHPKQNQYLEVSGEDLMFR